MQMNTSHLWTTLLSDRGGMILLGILAAAAVLVPIGNLLVPADSVFHVSNFAVSLIGKYLTFALFALSVDLVWGFIFAVFYLW